ncbi:MAG: DUF4416 family protein [Candidatus Hydrothermarchaeaceae archaeon]
MKAKIFCGMMYRGESVFEQALKMLVEKFGDIEKLGEPYAFNFTDYYEKEMGRGLKKRFAVFHNPIDGAELAEIKLFTNMLEKKLSIDGRRQVNVDPGYITRTNLVLATTKEFPHRIYLKDGIFAEVTLLFKRDGCKFLDWAYPDFREQKTCDFFRGFAMKC